MDDLMYFGDDFDALLDALEEDETFDDQFTAAVSDIQAQEIVCNECGKKYKTKSGFQRHIIAKHPEQSNRLERDQQHKPVELTSGILGQLVQSAVSRVIGNDIFLTSLRNELRLYSYVDIQDASAEFMDLKATFDSLARNGDTEKFYGRFYAKICINSKSFFKGLSQHAATLLSTKLADCMLTYCKGQMATTESAIELEVMLSEEEKAGLQYIGGYVLHKLRKKHSKTKSTEGQQAMAILKAGKLEIDKSSSQKLISCLDRGGLWHITEHALKVFSKTEHYFSSHSHLKLIFKGLTLMALHMQQ
eukprot:gene13603-15014_t